MQLRDARGRIIPSGARARAGGAGAGAGGTGLAGEIQTTNDPEWTLLQWRKATRRGLEIAVGYWHRRFMPNHFTVAGGKKYGYQPRKGDKEAPTVPGKKGVRLNRAYSWLKRRYKGHWKPLVWSGQSERMARRMIKITSRTRRSAHLVEAVGAMTLPKYFYQHRKDLKQPDKYRELITTTPDELEILMRVYKSGTLAALKRMPIRRRRRRVA